MKVFLVTSCSAPMVGIEKCQAHAVSSTLEAAFLKQYGSQVLASGNELPGLLPIPLIVYKGR